MQIRAIRRANVDSDLLYGLLLSQSLPTNQGNSDQVSGSLGLSGCTGLLQSLYANQGNSDGRA